MKHVPVLLHEAIEGLNVQADHWYLDGTFGRGGHTREILKLGGKVIAFDCDHEAIEFGKETFEAEIANKKLFLVHQNFTELTKEVVKIAEGKLFDGILFDFGVSTPQITESGRGISFQEDVELDMRLDNRLGVKAKDLLAVLSEGQLREIFQEFGGEETARAIARAIASQRKTQPLTTVKQLVDVIYSVKRPRYGGSHIHPATKVFQALRIAVNSELDSIAQALPQALALLAPHGRLVTISFHEGEDRQVKNAFRSWDDAGVGQDLTKKVIKPSQEEERANPNSRSGRLRIFEKK